MHENTSTKDIADIVYDRLSVTQKEFFEHITRKEVHQFCMFMMKNVSLCMYINKNVYITNHINFFQNLIEKIDLAEFMKEHCRSDEHSSETQTP